MAAVTNAQLLAQCDAELLRLQMGSAVGACTPAYKGDRTGKRRVCAALAAESRGAPGNSLAPMDGIASAMGPGARALPGGAAGLAPLRLPRREPGAAATPANPIDQTGGDSGDETPTGLVPGRGAGAPPAQGSDLGSAQGSGFVFADEDTQPLDELPAAPGDPESAGPGSGQESAPGSGLVLGPAATLPVGDLPPELLALRARRDARAAPAAPSAGARMPAAAAAPRAPPQQAELVERAASPGWADAVGATELPWPEAKRARPSVAATPHCNAPAFGPAAGALPPAGAAEEPVWPVAGPQQATAAPAWAPSPPDQAAVAPAWPPPAPSQAASAGKARNPLEDLLGFSLE